MYYTPVNYIVGGVDAVDETMDDVEEGLQDADEINTVQYDRLECSRVDHGVLQ